MQTTDRANCDSSTTSCHIHVPATSMLPPGTAACGTPNTPPHCTRKKKVLLLLKKKWGKWGLRHNSLVHAFLVYLFHLLSLGLRHNSPARFLFGTLSHPIQLSHRLRVVVSPIPAACPLRPLDTQFSLTLREEWHDQPTNKGRVSQPTNAAPLPFWAAA